MLIHDHHPGYIDWDEYLANRARLAANRTNTGARPPREGTALCQGIIGCGSCGRPMTIRYHRDGTAAYECHSLINGRATGTCRSISAGTIDAAVAAPAAGRADPGGDRAGVRRRRRGRRRPRPGVQGRGTGRRTCPLRSRPRRTGLPRREPENRLVDRTLESRWEANLAALAEAEAALTATRHAQPPLPARADLEALITDLPALFDADSTTPKDRKRLLRTLIADVTLLPETDQGTARIGITLAHRRHRGDHHRPAHPPRNRQEDRQPPRPR